MKYYLIILSLAFFLVDCKEKNKNILDKDSMYIDKILVDTVGDGTGFSFRIRVDNNSNKIINLYTGTGTTIKDTSCGFFLYCKKIKTYYALTAPYTEALLIIPANTMGKKVFVTIGFRPFSMFSSSEIFKMIDNYYTTKNKDENIKNFLRDIEVVYRVDKSKMGNSEDSLKVPIRNNVVIKYYYDSKTLTDVQQTLED